MRLTMEDEWEEIKETVITLLPVVVLILFIIIMFLLEKFYLGSIG